MNKVKKNWYIKIIEYIIIAIGTAIIAISINFFLEPNTIAPGGVAGLAIVLKKVTGIPIYVIILMINIPLFIAGVLLLGKSFGIKTFFATISLSFFIKILPKGNITYDLLLASVFGAILIGLGIGLVFRAGGTTGGTDLAGAILNKLFPNLSIANLMMIIDFGVVVVAGIVDKKVETGLYSVITLYTYIKVFDLLLNGLGYAKACIIISNNSNEIGTVIMKQLSRGVTELNGKGMYTKQDKKVLLCVVNRSQISKLKEIVYTIDPLAFVMVTEIHEVLGKGFKEVNN